MPVGSVKWFNNTKGYGFIMPEDGGADLFVHRTAVAGIGYDEELLPGERVEFGIKQTPKGLQAVDVQRLTNGK